ncbi:MAG TPA: RNA polymerase factor sigma-54 [Tepidisphaeraceae bacterium]|nr:RNA polymerase factor sigma-54 [Tepidisphaeraceae bacterium]
MQLSQSMGVRLEQRQLLTPRMIQSMEILQLPLMALEERIEQELQNNPVLELREGDGENGQAEDTTRIQDDAAGAPTEHFSEEERPMVVKEGGDQAEDFERLARISDYLENEEFSSLSGSSSVRVSSYDGERDKKLDAMNNTAARGITLQEHLLGQWAFVETVPSVRTAGEVIISNLDADGYLRIPLEQIQKESTKVPVALEQLQNALKLVQTLEPAGIAARDLQECWLLQLDAIERDEEMAQGHDFDLERALVRDHLKDLSMNRYPQISKKLARDITDIQAAVKRLGHLHPYPGKLIGGEEAPPITPDAVIFYDEDTDKYEIDMVNDPAPSLYISGRWRKYLKDKQGDKHTREFLMNNVRNARWLIESIQQRRSTIHRVIRAVVDAQRDFFDRGPEHLKPLPMISVADQLGIHVATVSRAVSEKWIQTPRGVFPLRRFFSGGTTSAEGEEMSWDAVKEKLKAIIDNEDKHNPLNDDEIVEKLKEQGIELARRTVAKYRKILDIPTARQRRTF